jgi:hypothetical protein
VVEASAECHTSLINLGKVVIFGFFIHKVGIPWDREAIPLHAQGCKVCGVIGFFHYPIPKKGGEFYFEMAGRKKGSFFER